MLLSFFNSKTGLQICTSRFPICLMASNKIHLRIFWTIYQLILKHLICGVPLLVWWTSNLLWSWQIYFDVCRTVFSIEKVTQCTLTKNLQINTLIDDDRVARSLMWIDGERKLTRKAFISMKQIFSHVLNLMQL